MDATAIVVDAARGLTVERRTRRWAHLSLCVLDAVFSIGARYSSTERTCRAYAAHARMPALDGEDDGPVIGTPAEQDLDRFLADVDAHGAPQFAAAVLQNQQLTSSRGGILKAEAARDYAAALVEAGVHRYADLPAMIASEERLASVEAQLRGVRGNGTGDVRLGYLWMLLGDDDVVKPDRMVLRWMHRTLGRASTITETRTLLAGVAGALGCTPWELDHAIWTAERGRRPAVRSDTMARRRHGGQQGR